MGRSTNMLRQILAFAALGALFPLLGQSYQTSFSEVKFDRAKSPATFNSGVRVDVASGAASMDIPMGPGIGARGLSYQPTLNFKTFPQFGVSSYQEYYLAMAGTNFEHTRSTTIDQLYSKGSGGASISPGTFDLKLIGIGGSSLQSSYSLPTGGGGTVLGEVPSTMNGNVAAAQALLARFGINSGVGWIPSAAGATKVPMIQMGSGGHLIIGLEGNVRDWVQYNDYNSGGNQWDFPRRIIVVAGEIAYEFSYVSHRYGRKMRPYLAISETNPLYSAHYLVTRALNRFGESISFTYGANGIDFTATHSTTGNVTKLEWVGTQSINATPSLSSDPITVSQATILRVSYQVSGTPMPSYTLVVAGPYGVSTESGGGPTSAAAQSPQGDRRMIDDIDDHSNWGSSLQGLQPISLTRDAAQDASAEKITFEYGTGPGNDWNGQVGYPVVLTAVNYPNRRVSLSWAPYRYRISYSPNAWGSSSGPVGRPGIGYGVTNLNDRDLIAGVSRITSYTRVVPQLYWSMSATSEVWTSTSFYTAVTGPDGQTSLHRFVSPANTPNASTGDEGFQNLCYLKHLETEVRYFESGVSWQGEVNGGSYASTAAYRIVSKDRFDLSTVGNSNGEFDKHSVPYPTRTRTWNRDSKVLSYEETTDWESASFAWKKAHRVSSISASPSLDMELKSLKARGQSYASPGASLGIEETTTKSFDNKVSEWLFNRVVGETSSRDADNTGFFANGTRLSNAKPAVGKVIDPVFNTPSAITLSNDEWWVQTNLVPKGSSGIAAAQLQSATLTGYGDSGYMVNNGNVGVNAYGYDANGYMNSISVMPNGSTTLTTQQAQDPLGRPTTQYDADGRAKSIQWDSVGRLKSITPPGEVGTELTYHDDLRGITLKRGAQEQKFRYNGFGEMVVEARKDPNGAWSHKIHGYDAAGRSSGETPWLSGDGSDHETTWKEADFAALTTVTVPGPDRCVRWGYDEDGNRVCTQWQSTTTTTTARAPLPHTSIAYDARGRVIKTTDLNGIVTQYTYGGWSNGGQKITTLAPGTDKAQTTTFQSDAVGRLVRVWDAIGNRTDYLFDGADRIGEVDQYDQAGRVQPRTWRYNALGWLTSLGQPESGTTSYTTFTVQGKPTVTSYNGRVVRSTLDWIGRPTAVWSDDGTVSQNFYYEPANGRGKLGSSRDGSVTAAFGYYPATGKPSSLTTTASGQTITQAFTYDSYGNRNGASTGRAWWSQSFHDAAGMPNLLSYNGTTVANTPWTAYDPNSWMSKNIYYGNGAASQFLYGNDQMRLAGMKHLDSVSSPQADWSYDYDAVGNLWRENDGLTQSSDQYAYDKLNRLISAFVQSQTYGDQLQQFVYDAFGNRISGTTERVVSWNGARATSTPNTTTTSVPNAAWLGLNAADPALWQRNQLPAQMTNGAYTGAQYDAQGNLTQVFEKPGGGTGTLTMTYDALGRVMSVAHSGKGVREVYQYRADGLRTVIDDYLWGSYQKTRIQIYNDARQLVSQWEKPGGGSLTWKRDIIYLGTREAAEFDAAGMHVTQVDHLGSPRVITGPNGRVEAKQKYLPFGELLERSGTIPAKGYTGHEQTDASGLIYMQARFYIPWFGRFASPDPARDQHFEFTQSWNIASYVRNNPVMSTDPTGMVAKFDHKEFLLNGRHVSPNEARDGQGNGTEEFLNEGESLTAEAQSQTNTLSGSSWVSQFPNSNSTADLADGFRQNAESFISAMETAGATVDVSSTLRPPERAYLMHYSYSIAKEGLDPAQVPAMAGVNINWVHKKSDGSVDLAASKKAAQEMVNGYGIVFKPALTSRHTQGNAIDMTISWSGSLSIKNANGVSINITSGSRNGSNAQLIQVGATYGLIKLITDPPHWSIDGH